MCTVTYIPRGNDEFILTSNRDENAARSPQKISIVEQFGQRLAFPRDMEAGGTWIAISNHNKVLCVLNGAFDRHDRNPPYKKSRGIMALEFFKYSSAEVFFQEYDFDGMEPFTLVLYDEGKLYDFRWDEKKPYARELDNRQEHIWSSSTLYTPEAKEQRANWFKQWQNTHQEHDLDAVMDFHRHAGAEDNWNGVIMNRNGVVQTVSITNIIKKRTTIELRYHDLLNTHLKKAKIDLRGEVVELH